MAKLRENEPTIKEFTESVKKAYMKMNKYVSEKEADEYIATKDSIDVIEDQYKWNLSRFEKGEIDRAMFLGGAASGPAYSLYLLE